MYSNPYSGIEPELIETLQRLIRNEDQYHVVHRRRVARTLQELLRRSSAEDSDGIKVLEIGTSGVVPDALAEHRPGMLVTVTNFDVRKDVLHEYVSPTGEAYPAYRVDLEYDRFPCEDETFDWVLCCEVLEHMEVDPMFMLSEVNRVLKTGGQLLLTTPNVASARGIYKMLNGSEPYLFMHYAKDRSYNRHNYEYSIHTVNTLLRAAGLSGGTLWTEDTFEDGMPSVVDRLHKAGFPVQHCGDNIFAVCRKTGPVVNRHPSEIYV